MVSQKLHTRLAASTAVMLQRAYVLLVNAYFKATLLLQVCAQCWFQLAKQDDLQLLSFSLDCISCTCHCWSGILHSRLLLGSQESLFPKGKNMSFVITPKAVQC